mmetsp:Transcript_32075/g.43422  ORF Transcript_32075/g.43422 Transcript_32075/m.43422 type:complete len:205 (-) Transcript_32075:112-726(-)
MEVLQSLPLLIATTTRPLGRPPPSLVFNSGFLYDGICVGDIHEINSYQQGREVVLSGARPTNISSGAVKPTSELDYILKGDSDTLESPRFEYLDQRHIMVSDDDRVVVQGQNVEIDPLAALAPICWVCNRVYIRIRTEQNLPVIPLKKLDQFAFGHEGTYKDQPGRGIRGRTEGQHACINVRRIVNRWHVHEMAPHPPTSELAL